MQNPSIMTATRCSSWSTEAPGGLMKQVAAHAADGTRVLPDGLAAEMLRCAFGPAGSQAAEEIPDLTPQAQGQVVPPAQLREAPEEAAPHRDEKPGPAVLAQGLEQGLPQGLPRAAAWQRQLGGRVARDSETLGPYGSLVPGEHGAPGRGSRPGRLQERGVAPEQVHPERHAVRAPDPQGLAARQRPVQRPGREPALQELLDPQVRARRGGGGKAGQLPQAEVLPAASAVAGLPDEVLVLEAGRQLSRLALKAQGLPQSPARERLWAGHERDCVLWTPTAQNRNVPDNCDLFPEHGRIAHAFQPQVYWHSVTGSANKLLPTK